MRQDNRPIYLFAFLAFAFLGVFVLTAHEVQARSPEVFTGIVKGVAVGGYDPVAYFTKGEAIKGSKDIALEQQGAIWRFASEENRAAFKAEPSRYAPQYGGYCAWAISRGYTAKGDPKAWKIVNGKLYLNYNQEVQRNWAKSTSQNIAKADTNWPTVLEK